MAETDQIRNDPCQRYSLTKPPKPVQGDCVNFEVSAVDDPVFQVLYEDDVIPVINKSGNLPCCPAGKLHQIRATLYSLGLPVVGDRIYGLDDHFYLRFISNCLTPEDLNLPKVHRQVLHAKEIQFYHTLNKEVIDKSNSTYSTGYS